MTKKTKIDRRTVTSPRNGKKGGRPAAWRRRDDGELLHLVNDRWRLEPRPWTGAARLANFRLTS